MSDINKRTAVRIAELLAGEIENSTTREDFGVIVRDVSPIDKEQLLTHLASLFTKTKTKLRVALVGEEELVQRFRTDHPKHASLIAHDEESAVQWRNQNLKTIVVIAEGPLAKAASLNTFRQLDEQPLIARLCDAERDKAEVVWLRTLWDALKSKRGPALALESLVRFSVCP